MTNTVYEILPRQTNGFQTYLGRTGAIWGFIGSCICVLGFIGVCICVLGLMGVCCIGWGFKGDCICATFGGSAGRGGGCWRPRSSARTDSEKSSFPFAFLNCCCCCCCCCCCSGGGTKDLNGLLKGSAWFVFLAVLAWAEMALRAAILDRLDEIRVSRSFLDGGLTELAVEWARCWKNVNNDLHICWD